MGVINLRDKFKLINAYWQPKIIAELNGQAVKIAKIKGEFIWHSHADEDEFFMVVNGKMEIHTRDTIVTLQPGEFYVVPRGVEHKPVAREEAHILMFEPMGTLNTGNVRTERTIEEIERI